MGKQAAPAAACGRQSCRSHEIEGSSRKLPTGAACFPMLPYSNRIAENHFDFGGALIDLNRTCPASR